MDNLLLQIRELVSWAEGLQEDGGDDALWCFATGTVRNIYVGTSEDVQSSRLVVCAIKKGTHKAKSNTQD